MINRPIIFILMFILVPVVSAIDFTISNVGVSNPGQLIYQGDSPTLTASITASTENFCDMICTWSINVGPDFTGYVSGNSNSPSTILASGENEIFPFRINTQGQGSTPYILEVTCDNENQFCFANPIIHQYSGILNFKYAGDSICTTQKEKCENYGSFTGTNDCACSNPPKECRPNSVRGADEQGCATYCGNSIKESAYESCSNCPSDIGKCDLTSCITGSECEGGFCVHEVCWNKQWRAGDNFCDINQGENCKNSEDCACKSNELCSNVGICERTEASKEEVTQAVKSGVQETLEVSKSRQKSITTGAIGLIILVIVLYIIYKFVKSKKTSINKEKEKQEKVIKKSTKRKSK